MTPKRLLLGRRSLLVAAVALLAARCADRPLPTAARPALAQAPHFVRWAGSSAPHFTATGTLPRVVNSPLRLDVIGGLSLSEYAASFWAVRGQSRTARLNYLSASGDTTQPFLVLTITDPDWAPGIGTLAVGDSILVTMTVDTGTIGVSLEPTGLHFATPAQLELWYSGAGGDLNGDGVVDSTDYYIATELLGMSYREGWWSDWTPIPATQSLADQSFTIALPHFSEYAVSW
jgi:hypothetical protein